MYVSKISIKKLRCFNEAKLKLQYPGREGAGVAEMGNINLLLGNNGAGKTTVLRALALSTVAPVIQESSGFVPYRLIRRADPGDTSVKRASMTADLVLHPQDLGPKSKAKPESTREARMSMDIERKGDVEKMVAGARSTGNASVWAAMFDNTSPAFLVLGYGASRRVAETRHYNLSEQVKLRQIRYLRVAGLFESSVSLIPLTSWLPQMKYDNPGRHKQVVNLIDMLLPEEAGFEGLLEEDEYYFEHMGTQVPFGSLSDGYRNYIGWIADMLYHICTGCPPNTKLKDNRGLVLVDEIDLLLHPEWQRTVVATISEALPSLQFVFTTHSPIVAGSLHRENIFNMEMDASGTSTVEQYKERIYGLSAEQVLHSSYFKLRTTRAAGFVEKELRPLSRKAMKGDKHAAAALMHKLSGKVTPPPSPRDTAKDMGRVDNSQFEKLLRVYAAADGAEKGAGGRRAAGKKSAKAGARKAGARGTKSRASKKGR
ncbi:MAG TPA: AAA family ATPase [Pyrinomonadaceae bacterium]|nr:AAA family ATPase [Pyrinomonadaceae bacterium]